MGLVIKKIRNKQYAYIAYRQGKKVIHKYLGPASNSKVEQKIKELKDKKRIPDKFFYLFWDTDPSKIDIKKHSRYIIERVLEIGDMDSVRWIQKLYPTNLIIETCRISRKISQRSKNFWDIWFGGNYAY